MARGNTLADTIKAISLEEFAKLTLEQKLIALTCLPLTVVELLELQIKLYMEILTKKPLPVEVPTVTKLQDYVELSPEEKFVALSQLNFTRIERLQLQKEIYIEIWKKSPPPEDVRKMIYKSALEIETLEHHHLYKSSHQQRAAARAASVAAMAEGAVDTDQKWRDFKDINDKLKACLGIPPDQPLEILNWYDLGVLVVYLTYCK